MPNDFYVYFHRDNDGSIFYVGKGTGRRAWSQDRHAVWHKYVNERLNGQYSVEIHKDGLQENEAEKLEDELIEKYGGQIVNWINPGRDFDYQALEEFHRLRNANREFVDETKQIESTNIVEAVERYRVALKRMREYESLTLERGLVAELGGGPDWGDINILNRITVCLQKQKRHAELIKEAEEYFSEFPSAKNMSIGKQVIKRVEKAREKLGQENA